MDRNQWSNCLQTKDYTFCIQIMELNYLNIFQQQLSFDSVKVLCCLGMLFLYCKMSSVIHLFNLLMGSEVFHLHTQLDAGMGL